MSVALTLGTAPAARQGWRSHLVVLGAVWAVLLVFFRGDAADMVSIWWNSSTFNHCLLIPPILAWLVWQRRPALDQLAPFAWSPGLALAVTGAIAWLLGEAGSVAFARQLGLILMLQGAVVACLGRQVARCLAFPIAFALFLVPFGEELVPFLQTLTAELATALLGLTGIPSHLEGIFITTPAGLFEVAEACAGAKFLIAMVALGALVAHLCFRSWPRRIAFLAASVVVPILANSVRAWGTILVAHQAGMDFAASFDHVIYGGIFFAIVIALMLAAGRPFFDRPADDPGFVAPDERAPPGIGLAPVAAALLAVVAAPLAWSSALASAGVAEIPSDYRLPAIPGWERIANGNDWRPRFDGADLVRTGRYRDALGREVDLAIAVYRRQGEEDELVAFGQGAAAPGWTWMADAPAPPGGRAERIASRTLVREVISFYRVGRAVTGSRMGAKLETMKVRLLGGPQRAVALLVSSRAPRGGASPRAPLDSFLAAMGPVERLADRAAGLD